MLLSVTTKTDSYLQFMTVLILFVFVLAITYLVTRWIANYQKGKAGMGNLEIIETCRVASNKYIQLDLQRDEMQSMGFADILEKVKSLKERGKE